MSRCESTVYWWDIEIAARCIRPEDHTGPHRDGIRWFDDDQLQVDGDPHDYRPGLTYGDGVQSTGPRRSVRSLTDDEVRRVRARYDAGVSVAVIARDFGLDYGVTYLCARRKTYRRVA